MDLLSGSSLGAACALGSAFTWALNSLLARKLAPVLGSVAINAIRTTAGGVMLLGWVLASDGPRALAMSWTTFGLLALSIVIAICIGDNLFFESSRAVGLARAMTVSMTYPLVTTVLAATMLGEQITLREAAGALITLAGILLVVLGRRQIEETTGHWWLGIGGAVVVALAWGVSPIMMKVPLQELDAAAAQSVRLPVAAVLLWMTPWTRGAIGQLADGGRPALVQMAVLSVLTAVSSLLYVAGLKYAGIAIASILASVTPVFSIPLGAIFLGERLSRPAVLGVLVTIAGIIVLRS